jgi:hypothetical protein
VPLFSYFNQNWNVLTDFSENPICEISQKGIWWEVCCPKHPSMQTDRQDILSLIHNCFSQLIFGCT